MGPLKKSHIEKGFSQHMQSLPTPQLTPLPTDALTTSQMENRSTWKLSETLVISGQGLRRGGELEDLRWRFSEEQKVEGIAHFRARANSIN